MNIASAQKDSPVILIVDDDQLMRVQLRRAMERSGYQVLEASDGEQALAVYARVRPDVVLLDAMMPVMDGFTCCYLLHQLSTGNTPTVIENESSQEGLSLGFHGVRSTSAETLACFSETAVHSSVSEVSSLLKSAPEAPHYSSGTTQIPSLTTIDYPYRTPVIMITSLDDQESVDRAFAAGAIDYITKPIHWAVLRQRVHRVLQESRAIKELRQQTERSLLSEEQLRLALKAAHLGIWDWDISTGKINYSITTEVNFGITQGSFEGTYESFLKRIHPEDYEFVTHALNHALENKAEYDIEFRVVWPDNTVHWVASKGQVYTDKSGQPARIIGINMNITERKYSEETLRQSEERFRTIVDTAQEGIWVLDSYANTTYVNQRMLEMLGYPLEEMLGRSLFTFMDEGDRIEAVKNFERRQPGINAQHDLRFLRKDGSEIWTILSTNPLLDKQGKFIGLLGMLTDITERRLSEQKIREQVALLDITSDAILVRGKKQEILFWNKGAERLYGWKAEEALGKNADELLYKQLSPQVVKNLETLATVSEWQGELYQITKEGKELIVESRWTMVRNDTGQPVSILTVNTDITEKKQLEKQFLRTQRLESLGTLAGGIAHDLNNVLAPILMSVQLLELKLKDEHSQQLISLLEMNVKRGADLVKQVLSFARGIDGERTDIQIGHLILEIKKVLSETFPKSITIRTDVPVNDLWTVCGDATQLHQVLMNLCVNARDAMPGGGFLNILMRNIIINENSLSVHSDAKPGSYVVIHVSDSGCGIPTGILDKIFEPFFTTKDVGKGTGLGLSTAMGIIKSHGGFMNVYSQVGKGTEFQVYLPATQTKTSQIMADHSWELLTGNGEVILIVDDEAAICEVAKASLESFDYKVMTANDGIEAIALYTQHREEIKVVIIDMMMPSMDGTTTIQILQRINPNVKIVIASGLMSNEKVAEIHRSGVTTLLPKPYTTEQLLNTLHDILG